MNDSLKAAALQAAGFSLALAAMGFVCWLFPDSKVALAVCAVGLVNWFVGKLTGTPLQSVTMQALRSLPPGKAKEAIQILSLRPVKPVNISWESDDEAETPHQKPAKKPRGPDSALDP